MTSFRNIILILTIFLVGCSHFKKSAIFASRDTSYLQAKSIPPLKIPPGVSSSAFQNRYPTPDREYPTSEYVSPVPPGLYS